MGSYREVEGDLIELFKNGEVDVIIHGTNCHNIMGAGIARDLAAAYPILLDIDKSFYIPVSSVDRLGNYSRLSMKDQNDNSKWVLNAYTQYNPGKNLDYNALELVLKKINFAFSSEKVGIPGFIGAGIAGGNPNVIRKIVQRQLTNCDVSVVFLPQNSHLMLEEYK